MVEHLDDVGALLLDMDGTLVDSDAAVERAWVTWAREYTVSLDGIDVHGRHASGTVRLLRPDLTDEEVGAAAARLGATDLRPPVLVTCGLKGLPADLTVPDLAHLARLLRESRSA